ncbi:MAG: hypothetical protein MI867_03765 [Pseudomonadales bacterium]|nr:hypothetical protein [Pseudomonadales bacterium]
MAGGLLKRSLLAFAMCLSVAMTMIASIAYADVDFPMLDIQSGSGDTAMTGDGSIINIDASVVALILNDENDFLEMSGPFSLSAEFDSVSAGYLYSFNNGSLAIGDVGSELLTATFDEFIVSSFAGGYATYEADLTYTGGSLYQGLSISSGRLEGVVQGLTTNVLTGPFSSDSVVMKVGEVAVVPLPAGVWLLGFGLLSILGIKRFR